MTAQRSGTTAKPLTDDTFLLLDRLATAPLGRSAAELEEICGFDGRPSSRLSHLQRRGYAAVDHHTGLWTITHEGWDHLEARAPERAREYLPLWRVHECGCRQCREFRTAEAA